MLARDRLFMIWRFTALICLLGAVARAGESSVQWQVQPILAGKVSLHNEAYQVIRPLGATRTSPDLQLTLQLVYDSKLSVQGLVGHGWRIPQLESATVPVDKNMNWTTPWGESIRFYPKTRIADDMSDVAKYEMAGKASHFAPYVEWEANGKDGAWTVTGKGAKKGWRFDYEEAHLQSITAPSGFELQFRYDKEGRPVRIVQEKRAFAELEYTKHGILKSLRLNEISITFAFESVKVVKLPDVPAAKPAMLDRIQLASYQVGTFAPVEFTYNETGYLTEQRQGVFVDTLTVDTETAEERTKYLTAFSAYEKKRQKGEKVEIPKREHVSGRLLADGQFAYAYPAKNRVDLKNKSARIASIAYDIGRGVVSLKDFSGKKTTINYYMRHDVAYNGWVRQVVDGRDRVVVSYRYDKETGNVTRVRDMADNEILISYDKNGNLTHVSKRGADELAAAPVAAFEHDKRGRLSVIARLDAVGKAVQTTTLAYTSRNLPSKIEDERGAIQVKYNDFGFPVSLTNAFGQTFTMAYSRLNRPESVTAHDGKTTVYTYNDNGLVVKVENFTDAEKMKLMSSLSVEYGDDGLPKAYTDHRNRRKTFERDEFGRVAKEFFPDDTQVVYTYDSLGQLRTVLDQNQHEIKFDWNAFGLAKRTTPADQVNVYDYDKFGLLKKMESKFVDAKTPDRVFAYEHDDFDRVTRIVYDDLRSESMEYDTWGRIMKATREDGGMRRVATMRYDHFGQLVEKTETEFKKNVVAQTTTRHYTYDTWGRMTKRRIVQSGAEEEDWFETKATWNYDKHGRLIAMTEGKDRAEYEFDTEHRLAKRTTNGMSVYYAYAAEGWLVSKSMGAPLGAVAGAEAMANISAPVAWLRYRYDPDGRISAREINGHWQYYVYDAKDQLVAVKDAMGQDAERYEYDPAGNVRAKTVYGRKTTYTYDAANQLKTSLDANGVLTRFAYDAAGRMVRDGEKTYHYGFMDKVLEVTEAGKTLHEYAYWTNGQLAQAKHHRPDRVEEESFLWDGLALIRRNTTPYLNEPHPSGGSPILAKGRPVFEDFLGNTIGLFEDEDTFSLHDSTVFGNSRKDVSSDGDINKDKDVNADAPFLTGKPEVQGIGYNFPARNFNTGNAAWNVADPLGYPDGWNNYSYVANQPTRLFDPTGCCIPLGTVTPLYFCGNTSCVLAQFYIYEAWCILLNTSRVKALAEGENTYNFKGLHHWLDGSGVMEIINWACFDADKKIATLIGIGIAGSNMDAMRNYGNSLAIGHTGVMDITEIGFDVKTLLNGNNPYSETNAWISHYTANATVSTASITRVSATQIDVTMRYTVAYSDTSDFNPGQSFGPGIKDDWFLKYFLPFGYGADFELRAWGFFDQKFTINLSE